MTSGPSHQQFVTARLPPGRGDFSISNFHPGPIPGNLSETIFGVRKVARAEGGWPVFGLPPLKKCRRRDRAHLVSPNVGWMQQTLTVAEVCYPSCRKAREASV